MLDSHRHRQRDKSPVEIGDDLLSRLRLIADELGGRALPIPVIVEALLREAAIDLEARLPGPGSLASTDLAR